MRRINRISMVILVILGLMASLLISACAPKLEGKVIKIGSMWDVSGPYASVGGIVRSGFADYIKYINDEGGIKGAKIEDSWVDTRTEPPKMLSAYKRFVEAGIVQVNFMTSVETKTLMELIKRDRIPAVTTSQSQSLMAPDSWAYGHYSTSISDLTAVVKWVHETHWDYKKMGRPPRLGFIGWDSPYGKDPIPGITKYAESLGMEIVGSELFGYGALDLTTELNRLKSAKVDFVMLTACNGGTAVTVKDGARVGLWEQANLLANCGAFTSTQLKLAGAAANGIYFAGSPFAWPDEDVAGVKFARELHQRYHPGEEFVQGYFIGTHHAMVSVEALRLALEKVSFEELDGTAVKEQGLDRLEWLDTKGLSGGVSYTDDPWHIGVQRDRIFKCVDAEAGKAVPVTDWFDVTRV